MQERFKCYRCIYMLLYIFHATSGSNIVYEYIWKYNIWKYIIWNYSDYFNLKPDSKIETWMQARVPSQIWILKDANLMPIGSLTDPLMKVEWKVPTCIILDLNAISILKYDSSRQSCTRIIDQQCQLANIIQELYERYS